MEIRSPEVIENERVEKLKEINRLREQLDLISEEKHKKKRELEDLTEASRKAKHLIATAHTDAEILQSEYWRVKNG